MHGYQTCKRCGQEFEVPPSNRKATTCPPCYGLDRRQRESAVTPYLKRLLQFAKSRAKAKALPIDIDVDYLLELWDKQEGYCAITGSVLTHHRMGSGARERNFNVSLDQKEPSKGYTKGNVQLICLRVNLLKSDMDSAEFYWWIKTLADKLTTR